MKTSAHALKSVSRKGDLAPDAAWLDMTFLRSRSSTSGRYPLGTIAAYGPDSTLATKLVVAVFERPEHVNRPWSRLGPRKGSTCAMTRQSPPR